MSTDKNHIVEISSTIKKVRLIQLSKRLNIEQSALFGILSEAGYTIHGNPTNFILNENHLKVISKVYSKSVKSYFNRTKKSIEKVSEREKLELFKFYKLFLLAPESYDENSIYNGHLEIGLIEKYFFSIVATINYEHVDDNVNNYFQVKIRLFKSFIEQKRKTISTFINYCYYNFSIDEEFKRSKSICFS